MPPSGNGFINQLKPVKSLFTSGENLGFVVLFKFNLQKQLFQLFLRYIFHVYPGCSSVDDMLQQKTLFPGTIG